MHGCERGGPIRPTPTTELRTRARKSRDPLSFRSRVIPTRVKADSFQGFQNGASSESCPSASATGPMHDAQCGLVLHVRLEQISRAGIDSECTAVSRSPRPTNVNAWRTGRACSVAVDAGTIRFLRGGVPMAVGTKTRPSLKPGSARPSWRCSRGAPAQQRDAAAMNRRRRARIALAILGGPCSSPRLHGLRLETARSNPHCLRQFPDGPTSSPGAEILVRSSFISTKSTGQAASAVIPLNWSCSTTPAAQRSRTPTCKRSPTAPVLRC